MTSFMDIYHDPQHTALQQLLSRVPQSFRDKLAEVTVEDTVAQIPQTAFAWPERRLFPVHTPEHAALSYLYAKHANQRVPEDIVEAIQDALSVYAIDCASIEPQQIKVAQAQFDPDDCIFPDQTAYPVRNAQEVKLAEERLLEQRHLMDVDTQYMSFQRLAQKAETFNVKLSAQSLKLAGLTYSDFNTVQEHILHRANLLRQQQRTKEAAEYEELSRHVNTPELRQLDASLQLELARGLGTLDQRYGLDTYYEHQLPNPLESVFTTSKVASVNDIDINGKKVGLADLTSLPLSFYTDLFGPEIEHEIGRGGQVDAQALSEVLPTLPSDTKNLLLKQLRYQNIAIG